MRLVRRDQILLHLQQPVGEAVRVDDVLTVADLLLQGRNALRVDVGGGMDGLRQRE